MKKYQCVKTGEIRTEQEVHSELTALKNSSPPPFDEWDEYDDERFISEFYREVKQ